MRETGLLNELEDARRYVNRLVDRLVEIADGTGNSDHVQEVQLAGDDLAVAIGALQSKLARS